MWSHGWEVRDHVAGLNFQFQDIKLPPKRSTYDTKFRGWGLDIQFQDGGKDSSQELGYLSRVGLKILTRGVPLILQGAIDERKPVCSPSEGTGFRRAC